MIGTECVRDDCAGVRANIFSNKLPGATFAIHSTLGAIYFFLRRLKSVQPAGGPQTCLRQPNSIIFPRKKEFKSVSCSVCHQSSAPDSCPRV